MMTAVEHQSPHAQKYLKSATTSGIVGSIAIHVAIAVDVWPSTFGLLVILASFGFIGVWNAAITWQAPRLGFSRAELIRLAPNLTSCMVLGALLNWPVAIWIFLPYVAVFDDGLNARAGWRRLGLFIVLWDAIAVATGAGWHVTLAFSALAVICHQVTVLRQQWMRAVLADLSSHIVELSNAREELAQASRLALVNEKLAGIGMLAAGVAHEINNPMSYVSANVRALLEDLRATEALPPMLIEYRDEILPETIGGIIRVNSIVADLRHFASGEVARPATFDVNTEVKAATRIATPQLGSSQTIRCDFQDVATTFGDGRQIGQVVLNLIINGIHALAVNGEVLVATKTDRDAVVVEVSDDGAGMSPETRLKLFQPFFTTKTDGQGTGLGLSVAHGIVASHGGRIDVSSTLGSGSRFTIWLPRRLPPVVAPRMSGQFANALPV